MMQINDILLISTLLVLSAALLTACGGSGGTDDQLPNFDASDTPTLAQKDAAAAQKLQDLFDSGMALKCTYDIRANGQTMQVASWIQGPRSHVVVTGMMESESINTLDGAYVKVDPDQEGLEGCDWMLYADQDADTPEYADIPEYDEDMTPEEYVAVNKDVYLNMDCDQVKVDESVFEPDGTVCSIEDLAQGMLDDMGAGFDMGDMQ